MINYPNRKLNLSKSEINEISKGLNSFNLKIMVKDEKNTVVIKKGSNCKIDGNIIYFDTETMIRIDDEDLPKNRSAKSYYFFVKKNNNTDELSNIYYKINSNIENTDDFQELFLFSWNKNQSFFNRKLNGEIQIADNNETVLTKNKSISAISAFFNNINILKNGNPIILRTINAVGESEFQISHDGKETIIGNKNSNFISIDDENLFIVNNGVAKRVLTENDINDTYNNLININKEILSLIYDNADSKDLKTLLAVQNIQNELDKIEKEQMIAEEKLKEARIEKLSKANYYVKSNDRKDRIKEHFENNQ